MIQRWLWLFVLAVNGTAAVTLARGGSIGLAIAIGVVGLIGAYWISPWKGGRSARHAEVLKRPANEREVVIYWRPGCQFCAALKQQLGSAGKKAVWVNIWQDRKAAEFVRSVNNGNETVPTVVLDDEPQTNPEPDLVLARLDR